MIAATICGNVRVVSTWDNERKGRAGALTPPGCGRLVGVDMADGTCPRCDASLAGKRKDAKFCSPKCAQAAWHADRKAEMAEAREQQGRLMEQRPCEVCDDPLGRRDSRTKFCSIQCTDWNRLHPGEPIQKTGRQCRHCGGSLDGRRLEVRYCSPRCQMRGLKGIAHREDVVNCGDCGQEFTRQHGAQKYCSDGCRQRSVGRNWYNANVDRVREQRRDYRRHSGAGTAAYHRRKARKRGAEVEVFTNREIFERDGWVCRLCQMPVDERLEFPHPLSPSLDHKVPVSKNGPHTRANTQLAHLFCNIAKQDGGEVDRAVAAHRARRAADAWMDRSRLDNDLPRGA